MQIALIATKRIKSIEASPDFKFFTTLTSENVAIWNTQEFKDDLAENETDLMIELEPYQLIERKQRLTSCSITLIKEFTKLNLKKKQKKVKPIAKVKTEKDKQQKKLKKDKKKLEWKAKKAQQKPQKKQKL